MSISRFQILLGAVLCCCWLFAAWLLLRAPFVLPVELSLQIVPPAGGSSYALYYDAGAGYAATRMSVGRVSPAPDGESRVDFFLPANPATLQNIRFDPDEKDMPATGVVREHRIRAVSLLTALPLLPSLPLGTLSVERLFSRARPLHGVESLELASDGLVLRTRGEDPHLEFRGGLGAAMDTSARLAARWPQLLILLFLAIPAAWLARGRNGQRLLERTMLLAGHWAGCRRADQRPAEFFAGKCLPWALAGTALFIFLQLVRSFDLYATPGLYIEDITHYFQPYYGKGRPFAEVFHLMNGYPALGTNLVAWLAAFADVRLQPPIYLAMAASLSLAAVAAPAFSGLFRLPVFLLIVPSVLGLSGINHILFHITLTEQVHVAILLLLSLLFFRVPSSFAGLSLFFLASVALVWFGPYSVAAIPAILLLLLFFGDRRKAIFLGLLLAVVLAYFLTVERGMTDMSLLHFQERRQHLFQLLVGDVFYLGLAGVATVWHLLGLSGALGFLVWLLRRDRVFLKNGAVFLVVVVASLVPYFMSAKYMPGRHYEVHTFISLFFWLLFVLYALERFCGRLQSGRTAVAALLFLALMALVYWDNVRHPEKGTITPMPQVMAFARTLRYVEGLQLQRRNQVIILRLPSYDGSPDGDAVLWLGKDNPHAERVGREALAGWPAGKPFVVEPEGGGP